MKIYVVTLKIICTSLHVFRTGLRKTGFYYLFYFFSFATTSPFFCDWLHWEHWKSCCGESKILVFLMGCDCFSFSADVVLHNIIGYLQYCGLTPKKYVVRLYIEPRYKQIRITNCVGSFLQVKLLLNFPHSNVLGQGHNALLYKHERGIKSFWISSLVVKICLGSYQRPGGVSVIHSSEEEIIDMFSLQMHCNGASICRRRPPICTRDLATQTEYQTCIAELWGQKTCLEWCAQKQIQF